MSSQPNFSDIPFYVESPDTGEEQEWLMEGGFRSGEPASLSGDPDSWHDGCGDEVEVFSLTSCDTGEKLSLADFLTRFKLSSDAVDDMNESVSTRMRRDPPEADPDGDWDSRSDDQGDNLFWD